MSDYIVYPPSGGGVTLPIAISDVTDLQSELDAKLESPIAISDVTNLQTELDTIPTTDADLLLTNQSYTGNASGATTQEDVNNLFDAFSAGGGGTIQNANLSIQAADEGTVAGNARGANAVDLQTSRDNSTQVASGLFSAITSGWKCTASSFFSCVNGGDGHIVSGNSSVVNGGRYATITSDYSAINGGYNLFGHIYGQGVNSGRNNRSGKISQDSKCTLQLTTTTATANQIMYISGTIRITIPTNTAYGVEVFVTALDTTNNANSYTYKVVGNLLNNNGTVTWSQDTSNSSTIIVGGGCGSVTVSADNTNNALQVAVTPNSANTIVWQAKVSLVEVQE